MSVASTHYKSADVVELNVSDKIFTTTVGTLTKTDNFFKTLFTNLEKGMSTTRDKEGRIFIDRPHKPFKTLQNYLQTGCLIKRNPDIELEAGYFQIQLPANKSPSVPTKEEIMKKIKAIQKEIRNTYYSEDWHGEEKEGKIKLPKSLLLKNTIDDLLNYANSFYFKTDDYKIGHARFRDGAIVISLT